MGTVYFLKKEKPKNSKQIKPLHICYNSSDIKILEWEMKIKIQLYINKRNKSYEKQMYFEKNKVAFKV